MNAIYDSSHRATRNDCGKIILDLVKILYKSGLTGNVDFIAYGSYFEKWRNGLSDLDGMFYFSKLPLDPSLRKSIGLFQKEIAVLYQEMPFLKPGQFLYDIFILDPFHGHDGRFIVFDRDWIEVFWKYTKWKIIHGKIFVSELNPVAFRNQNEFELALGLHKLRNYWLFEIPRAPSEMSLIYAANIIKFFKVLPRTATIITGRPMAQEPQPLETYFPNINFEPLIKLFEETETCESQDAYLQKWHEPGNHSFIECLLCFEDTLIELVKNFPMKSKYLEKGGGK